MSNQTFPVIYGLNHYLVDPNMLFNASKKFALLVQPFGNEAPHCQLVILHQGFSERNINNFLRLVQGLPTDVQDSEMKEICEIAKMFQADQIYNTGLSFVTKSIDSSFYVPDTKYETGCQTMMLEHQAKMVHHFDEDDDIEFTSEDDSYDKNSENKQKEEKKVETVIYEIRIDRPMMKCHRYHFIKNGEVLFSAKKKGNMIVIGKGADIHLKSSTVNHCAQITQEQMHNVIHVEGQSIILKYVIFDDSKAISMSISFLHKNEQIYWFPKQPKLNPKTGGYVLRLSGSHHRRPMNSSKNSVLKNAAGHCTFITRLMGTDLYEAECHPDISPVLVFSIALSSILGPSINNNNVGAHFEIVEKPETIFAGKIIYAKKFPNINSFHSAIDSFPEDEKQNVFNILKENVHPICDINLSVNFWLNEELRAFGFVREVMTEAQPNGVDVYKMPASLFIRAYTDKETSQLICKEKCEIWELFAYIRNFFMPSHSFQMAQNGAQELEVFDTSDHSTGYAYMPVVRT